MGRRGGSRSRTSSSGGGVLALVLAGGFSAGTSTKPSTNPPGRTLGGCRSKSHHRGRTGCARGGALRVLGLGDATPPGLREGVGLPVPSSACSAAPSDPLTPTTTTTTTTTPTAAIPAAAADQVRKRPGRRVGSRRPIPLPSRDMPRRRQTACPVQQIPRRHRRGGDRRYCCHRCRSPRDAGDGGRVGCVGHDLILVVIRYARPGGGNDSGRCGHCRMCVCVCVRVSVCARVWWPRASLGW